MIHVKPKKGLGQHFLTDKNIARKITGYLSRKGYDHLIEVGPGTGVLTEFLLETENRNISLIEIDPESAGYLKKRFPEHSDRIIEQDFLKYPLGEIHSSQVAIIGNFPYNISSQIFFKILDNRHLVAEVVCMLQKEVADRIAAPPGSKTYGILSVLLQAFYRTEFLFNVGRQVFLPPPNVNSAVIRLSRREEKTLGCNEKLFFRVVKTGFNQRRKMLRNSLAALIMEKDTADPLLSRRPEQLAVEDFVRITNFLDTGQ
jgi:16S rRNA (adenine1518-N6/adenine1519-N6)-dimethyltransferase